MFYGGIFYVRKVFAGGGMRKILIIFTTFLLCSVSIVFADKMQEVTLKHLESSRGSIAGMEGEAKYAVELGWRYFNKGDMDTALRRFNQALLTNKDYAPAYFGIAYIYSVQNKLDLAIKNYKKSIELDPAYSHSYSNLGLALVYSEKLEEAFPYLRKAIELDPRNGDAHVNIAEYYFVTKDYSKSWEHVRIAQKLGAKVSEDFLQDLSSKFPPPKEEKEEKGK